MNETYLEAGQQGRNTWLRYLVFSTEAGAMSHLPAAALGLAACDAVILYLLHRMRRRPSEPAGHHG